MLSLSLLQSSLRKIKFLCPVVIVYLLHAWDAWDIFIIFPFNFEFLCLEFLARIVRALCKYAPTIQRMGSIAIDRHRFLQSGTSLTLGQTQVHYITNLTL